tara:strand:- start:2192 stop:2641 length:450 start_codon:yes stop_codon:yes gene_type:complete
MKSVEFDRNEIVKITKKLIDNIEGIFEDKRGKYITGSSKYCSLECDHNKELLLDNYKRFRLVVKNFENWSSLGRGKKPVLNHLKFFFRLLNGEKELKYYKGHMSCDRIHSFNKLYIPVELLDIDELQETINPTSNVIVDESGNTIQTSE